MPVKKKSTSPASLSPSDLYRPADPASLGFNTTDDLPDLEHVIGQPRAIRSLELGSQVTVTGYNIFVVGLPGSGRTTLSREYLQQKAVEEPVPDDWCYVNNFEEEHKPRALRLPAGRGAELRKDMQQLIQRTLEELPRYFSSDDYTREREKISSALEQAKDQEFRRLQQLVASSDFTLTHTASGTAVVPAVNGQPMTNEEFAKLSEEEQKRIEEKQAELADEVQKTFVRLRDLEGQTTEELSALSGRTAIFVLTPMFGEITAHFEGLQNVLDYLEAARQDMAELFESFSLETPGNASEDGKGPSLRDILESRYQVNLLVDNSETKGAPVVVESYPNGPNLLGRIEQEIRMGVSRTHYTMIRAGALHTANGGYLILPARDLFISESAWNGLKRALRDGAVRIADLGNQRPVGSPASLDPEPIPLDIKVVIIGTPSQYDLARNADEDFVKLFKVRAEFATVMDRTPETEHEYGLFVKSVVLNQKLPTFDVQAVARVIEYSARLTGRQDRLSARFGHVADMISESAYWAVQEKRKVVTRADVQRAIDESIYRNNLYEERLQDLIDENTLLITTSGSAIGQVNVMAVISMGDYAFGKPTRLTASAYPGQGGIIDIERQSNLGGSIHTKGMLILSGFIGNRYARNTPLSVTASLTFEQSYEGVEGDSASAAELVVLLSAIAQVPLRQDRAITGSINQHGQIQAIGGVNEKIEGFFDICQDRGLTGEQGVIIPEANVRHLMLRQAVIEAVSAGKFHIWAVGEIDQALSLLTDMEPGAEKEDGTFPEGTFNQAVQSHLEHFAKLVKTHTNHH